MQLAHYLKPESIIVPLQSTTKKHAFAELVAALCQREQLSDSEKLLHAIEEREKSSSTFLPMGIAVPHARIPDVNDIVMILGISPAGIQDEGGFAPLEAHLFFLFFSSTTEKEFGKHLKLLARIAAVFSDPQLVADIADLKTPQQIFARIQKRERQIDKE
ncbi:MAG: PTS sugar transporter subunit IIA [Deltaproteobacteria bacterium]|nr:PTS sugar transporter subunit IIA [Deltaproteobacteria bacterium]